MPKDKPTSGPLITVKCVNPKCETDGREQIVPAGVSLTPSVLLTGTLSCSVCGSTLETIGGVPRQS